MGNCEVLRAKHWLQELLWGFLYEDPGRRLGLKRSDKKLEYQVRKNMKGYQEIFYLLGRILLSQIFLLSAIHKILTWQTTVGWVASRGLPAASWLLGVAVVVELFGGLSLLLGWRLVLGASLLLIYLIGVTFLFHSFWTFQGAERQMQSIMFLKNLAIGGGLCLLVSMGSRQGG
ncbi:DoxX family protein [Candidatus Methylacidithermus pantelleriae]|uniref:DoxX family protein n=1 Tax=Candidatus Methylacidithermus pantelleriae TaxID=2744239 RepID=A0A8J2BJK3_9BACT|nr:DoxX family protein [Candidatus Methylacidithermus pantelleriae]CAF0697521.1 membrane hypothetical protein [Candidatus Methylacidithermus pantelleriae]